MIFKSSLKERHGPLCVLHYIQFTEAPTCNQQMQERSLVGEGLLQDANLPYTPEVGWASGCPPPAPAPPPR